MNTVFTMDGPRKIVVEHLIHRAKRSMLKHEGGTLFTPTNIQYQKACDVYHSPTMTKIALTREILIGDNSKVWHCSISFTDLKLGKFGPQRFDPESAAEWLRVIFGKWVSQIKPMTGLTSPNNTTY